MNHLRFFLRVALCAALAVWLTALLSKSPSITVVEWLRQEPVGAVFVAALAVAAAVWWFKPFHWRDFESTERDDNRRGGGIW